MIYELDPDGKFSYVNPVICLVRAGLKKNSRVKLHWRLFIRFVTSTILFYKSQRDKGRTLRISNCPWPSVKQVKEVAKVGAECKNVFS